MKEKTIGIIGVGELGHSLYQGLNSAGYSIVLNNGDIERTRRKLEIWNIQLDKARSVQELVRECSTIFLCIKAAELAELGSQLNMKDENLIVISCLAQASLERVQKILQSESGVVKLMTTLAVQEKEGVSAYQLSETATAEERQKVREIVEFISAVNCVMELETERQMQIFTVFVGCFPGILAFFLEQLEWLIEHIGGKIFQKYARMLPVLLRSTAELLDKSGSARELRRKVSTEGGVTEAIIFTSATTGWKGAIEAMIQGGLQRMNGNASKKQ